MIFVSNTPQWRKYTQKSNNKKSVQISESLFQWLWLGKKGRIFHFNSISHRLKKQSVSQLASFCLLYKIFWFSMFWFKDLTNPMISDHRKKEEWTENRNNDRKSMRHTIIIILLSHNNNYIEQNKTKKNTPWVMSHEFGFHDWKWIFAIILN